MIAAGHAWQARFLDWTGNRQVPEADWEVRRCAEVVSGTVPPSRGTTMHTLHREPEKVFGRQQVATIQG